MMDSLRWTKVIIASPPPGMLPDSDPCVARVAGGVTWDCKKLQLHFNIEKKKIISSPIDWSTTEQFHIRILTRSSFWSDVPANKKSESKETEEQSPKSRASNVATATHSVENQVTATCGLGRSIIGLKDWNLLRIWSILRETHLLLSVCPSRTTNSKEIETIKAIDSNSCYLIMGASASINYAEHKLCNQKCEKGLVVTHDNMSHRTRKTRCVSSHLITLIIWFWQL